VSCSGCWACRDSAATAGNPGRTEPGRAAIDAATGAAIARRRNDGRPVPASPSGSERRVSAVGEFARSEAGSAADPAATGTPGTALLDTDPLETDPLETDEFAAAAPEADVPGTDAVTAVAWEDPAWEDAVVGIARAAVVSGAESVDRADEPGTASTVRDPADAQRRRTTSGSPELAADVRPIEVGDASARRSATAEPAAALRPIAPNGSVRPLVAIRFADPARTAADPAVARRRNVPAAATVAGPADRGEACAADR